MTLSREFTHVQVKRHSTNIFEKVLNRVLDIKRPLTRFQYSNEVVDFLHYNGYDVEKLFDEGLKSIKIDLTSEYLPDDYHPSKKLTVQYPTIRVTISTETDTQVTEVTQKPHVPSVSSFEELLLALKEVNFDPWETRGYILTIMAEVKEALEALADNLNYYSEQRAEADRLLAEIELFVEVTLKLRLG